MILKDFGNGKKRKRVDDANDNDNENVSSSKQPAIKRSVADFNFQVDDYGLLSFFMGNGLLQPFQYGILARSSEPIPAQKWTVKILFFQYFLASIFHWKLY